jgi:cyclopropane-fatty-acyl-phospholipid synthase
MPLWLRAMAPILSRVVTGTLRLRWTDGREWTFGGTDPEATLLVHDAAAVRRALLGGPIGFAEGYISGEWDSPDLVALLDLLGRNMPGDARARTPAAPKTVVHRARHAAHANTRRGSRRNIAAHYDLGNDFYRLWLDPSMTYSCALFDGAADTLETAQVRKWDALLDLISPEPGDSLLEIGCGWGGFAIHAAKTRGVRVTGLTVSREQYDWARDLVEEEGLLDRVDIRLQDYRDVTGTFDHVASIEMFEAVGERYWPTFFRVLRERLRPGGTAALQVITIADGRFEDYRRHPDFIQHYVFPGGMLPSPSAFRQAAEDADLAVGAVSTYGREYAMTLAEWQRRFESALAEVLALGFDERFERVWRYYLAYCQAGFRNGICDVIQVALG